MSLRAAFHSELRHLLYRRWCRTITYLALIVTWALLAGAVLAQPVERLSVAETNPRYLQVNDAPVFLLGATHAHGWAPVSRPHFDFEADLDRLAASVGAADSEHIRGLVRVVPYDPMNHLHDGEVERVLQPWERQPDGQYQLDRFEPEWEERLRSFLEAALERGIIVSLEIWDDWSVTRGQGGAWDPGPDGAWNAHPFNPANNVNYGEETLPSTTSECDAPFYRTTPALDDNETVLELQQQYVHHLLSLVSDDPHVLFNLSNESRASLAWSRYWAEYVRERLPEGRLIGEMPSTNRVDGGGECDYDLSPATLAVDDRYDYVDIAQAVSRHEFDEDIMRQAIEGGERIAGYLARMEAAGRIKPLVVSKDYSHDAEGGPVVLWSRFMSSAATTRFHRPGSDTAHLSDFHFEAVETLARFASDIPFWEMTPARDRIASLPDGLGANVLAGDEEIAVQLVGGSGGEEIELNLDTGSYELRWFLPSIGDYLPAGSEASATIDAASGTSTHLHVPEHDGHIILRLSRP